MVSANMKKQLTVYKASAGSGKTFTLATEYIKLLINNPQCYRQILAVTFTNKATEEMKTRILSQLYGIWQQLPESRRYAQKIENDLNASPEQVSRQAGIALHNLLHNYSYFRVETIDSFFQSVLRNLARELDLTPNLRIGLNDIQVEEQAVDQIIDALSSTDLLLQWLLSYIMDNISEDRSWNVIGQIKKFGKNIFSDVYKENSDALQQLFADEHFFDRYTQKLRDLRRMASERMMSIADAFFAELEAEQLGVEDLQYGKQGVAGMFLKIRQGEFSEKIVGKRVADCLDNPEKWCSKTHRRREEICRLGATSLGEILRYAVAEQPRQYSLYQSAGLTLRHLSQLRLLGTIEQKVHQLNDESNRFLLSDTQQLLHGLIEGSDTPFIFEKMGSRLEHIMIDEFQDTSTVQWQNFKVLLSEAMSHEDSHNLIVGDVKQSIYRWRGGDWRLLAHIADDFKPADKQLDLRTLDTNYRSSRRVVAFNNAFFSIAAQTEDAKAYDDVVQRVPDDRPSDGFVELTLLPSTDYQTDLLQRLTHDIGQLIAGGVEPSHIAVLVRSNRHIPLIASHLMEQLSGVGVVSDEAFRLDASPAVVCIMQALHYLIQPDDDIARAFLSKMHTGQLDGPLPEGFTADLLMMPLCDLTERLYHLFHLNDLPGQTAYVNTFFDHVADYVSQQTSDVGGLLREWDESIGAKTIQSPEINGVRLISIHKSKGLEFPHVFIPFCDWRLEHADVLWCQPREEPFCELPLVPVDYSQGGMRGTVYEACYDEEHRQIMVDNLNLLYVAFTRAVQSLHVYGKRGSRASRSYLIEQVIPQLATSLDGAIVEGEGEAGAPLYFSYGQPEKPTEKQPATLHPEKPAEKQAATLNPFLTPPQTKHVLIGTFSEKVQFRQSNKSREFADSSAEEPSTGESSYIQMGKVLHSVFSTIRTTADIDPALRSLAAEGIIYDIHNTPQRIETMIRRRLADERVSRWFDGHWQLFNECTIIGRDPQGQTFERRPDRVMTDGHETIVVDFKFGRRRAEYSTQVLEYMQLLKAMGMPSVKGYLWYVYSNQIEEVTESNTHE